VEIVWGDSSEDGSTELCVDLFDFDTTFALFLSFGLYTRLLLPFICSCVFCCCYHHHE